MEGCEDSFTTGYPSGFPFHDLHVKLEELTFVPGAPPNLYRFALVQAINAAAKHASPVILEPLMRLSMQVDAAHLRPLLADLSNKRRGTVVSLNQNKHIASLEAEAPLRVIIALLFCYDSNITHALLRSCLATRTICGASPRAQASSPWSLSTIARLC